MATSYGWRGIFWPSRPAVLAELHDRPYVLLRREDLRPDEGLPYGGYTRSLGHVVWRVNFEHAAVCERYPVLDARHRRQQLEVVFALEALPHDVHVKQAQEAAAEPKPKGIRGLGLPRQRGIV